MTPFFYNFLCIHCNPSLFYFFVVTIFTFDHLEFSDIILSFANACGYSSAGISASSFSTDSAVFSSVISVSVMFSPSALAITGAAHIRHKHKNRANHRLPFLTYIFSSFSPFSVIRPDYIISNHMTYLSF